MCEPPRCERACATRKRVEGLLELHLRVKEQTCKRCRVQEPIATTELDSCWLCLWSKRHARRCETTSSSSSATIQSDSRGTTTATLEATELLGSVACESLVV